MKLWLIFDCLVQLDYGGLRRHPGSWQQESLLICAVHPVFLPRGYSGYPAHTFNGIGNFWCTQHIQPAAGHSASQNYDAQDKRSANSDFFQSGQPLVDSENKDHMLRTINGCLVLYLQQGWIRLGECSDLCRQANLFYSDYPEVIKLQRVIATLSKGSQMKLNLKKKTF